VNRRYNWRDREGKPKRFCKIIFQSSRSFIYRIASITRTSQRTFLQYYLWVCRVFTLLNDS
jgi:hypothetical protein